MMKKIIASLIPIFGVIIIHLIFSYANWQINPKYWGEVTRGIAGFAFFITVVLGVMAAIEIIINLKE